MKTLRPNDTSAVSIALFLTLFASQSGVIALSPVLTQVASDLDVSAATAGQLRTITGLAAGSTALALARAARRLSLRSLMLAGTGLVAAGSVASAVAPGYEWLALAQVAIGIGVAVLLTSATTAAAEWVPDEHRARVLSWALIGQPAAWIVGMPLIGALGELSWRYGLLAMPLLGSALAAAALAARPRTPPVDRKVGLGAALGQAAVARWAAAELLASAGWTGTLVYSGALFSQSYKHVVPGDGSRSRRRGRRLRRRERRVSFAGRRRRPKADHPAVARTRRSAADRRSDPARTRSQRSAAGSGRVPRSRTHARRQRVRPHDGA